MLGCGLVSEAYFKFVDTDWVEDYAAIEGEFVIDFPSFTKKLTSPTSPLSPNSNPIEQAYKKTLHLLSPPPPQTPLLFSEFGTRRRRSYKVHEAVLKGLIRGNEDWKEGRGESVVGGGLGGTSNVSDEVGVGQTMRLTRLVGVLGSS